MADVNATTVLPSTNDATTIGADTTIWNDPDSDWKTGVYILAGIRVVLQYTIFNSNTVSYMVIQYLTK